MDGEDKPDRSIIVFEAESLEAARTIFAADPFVQQGVFASWEVKPWRLAIDHTAKRG
ncbi:MAG: YciI family protein [Candidatus Devosia symbiotica]|nr:YciI family protein [Candidatus Devosia symbiotica]